MKAKVLVTLKSGVHDPQGQAIATALDHLGFTGVDSVSQGKYIELELANMPEDKARAQVEQMCEKLLANTVIEKYEVELVA
jgi:phosphoribosylformylglycinamidine synthase